MVNATRRGRTASGQTGQEEWRDLLMSKGVNIALVTYTRWVAGNLMVAREGHNQRELSVMKGDYLEILNNDKKWWKARNSEAEVGGYKNRLWFQVGFVPYTILKSIVYRDGPTYWEVMHDTKMWKCGSC